MLDDIPNHRGPQSSYSGGAMAHNLG
jgi:hypothetical protein